MTKQPTKHEITTIKPNAVNSNDTQKLLLAVRQDTYIPNVVTKIMNTGTIDGTNIARVYISKHRVCIEMTDGIEFSIPVKGSKLF